MLKNKKRGYFESALQNYGLNMKVTGCEIDNLSG
jgi:hypothetical protein